MEYLNEFRVHLMEEEKSQLTIEKYVRDVMKFFEWIKQRPLDKAEVLAYKAYLLEEYAISSVNSMLSALNCYLDFCGQENCKVKTVKMQRNAFCNEEKELTKADYKQLLQAAGGNPRLRLLMQTIASTGIRVSEHRFITVEAVKQGKAVVQCKGKLRTILLPNALCRVLMKYIKRYHIKKGSIFVTKSGRPMDRSRIWAEMKKLCQSAKVLAEKVFPHNLRHLFARTFYSEEKDIVRLADILGHVSINTTRIYTKESGSVHRRQIEKISLLLIT